MSRADRLAAEQGTHTRQLMEAAGWAVARAALAHGPCRTLVLCGPGSNGGDGYVAARLLAARGWPVAVAALGRPAPGSDAADAAASWHGPWAEPTAAVASRADLLIDALYGAGLSRPLDGPAVEVLRTARRVLAVDVPSGLDGATGQVLGYARQAAETVTFVRRKPGHLLLPGRTLCGTVRVADIGMPRAVLDAVGARTFANGPGVWTLPAPDIDAHKFARGYVTVLGGAAMTGAARLAAAAARRAGAGMVAIAARGRADTYRAGDPGLLVFEEELEHLLYDERRTTWVCGPGLGVEEARRCLPFLLSSGRQVVADADALGACAGEPERLRGAAVLTPHAGEFARLFGPAGNDKLGAAREAAERSGAVVLLKGPDTVIAAPDGRAAINGTGTPYLATAGAGDVLSGVIAALLAAGMPPFDAACAGAWLHGRAGELAGPGLLAEDLPARLPAAMTEGVRAPAPP